MHNHLIICNNAIQLSETTWLPVVLQYSCVEPFIYVQQFYTEPLIYINFTIYIYMQNHLLICKVTIFLHITTLFSVILQRKFICVQYYNISLQSHFFMYSMTIFLCGTVDLCGLLNISIQNHLLMSNVIIFLYRTTWLCTMLQYIYLCTEPFTYV